MKNRLPPSDAELQASGTDELASGFENHINSVPESGNYNKSGHECRMMMKCLMLKCLK